MPTVMRLVACGIGLLVVAGRAEAQDAREFWQQEWQRQPRQQSSWDRSGWDRAGSDRSGWERPAYREQGNWFGGQQPRGYSGRQGRADRRAMPSVHVSNPDFLVYTPDKLTDVALGAVCAFPTAASAQPAVNAQAAAGASDDTAAPNPPAEPAPSASPDPLFVQACATRPALSLRLLPQVGDAVVRHYAAHPQFLWSEQGRVSARAQAAIATLAASDAVGLDPADYRVALPEGNNDAAATARALLSFELALSAKVLTYVLDATRGRIDPNRLSGYHDLPRKSVNLAEALAVLAQSSDVAASLMQRNPDNAQFRALVAELARQRDTPDKAARLRMAMERLRWLPSQLGKRYVFLNQAAFEVTYVDGASAPLTMRAVIGRPDAQTYFFTDRIREITYNPYWNVPRSIVVNEMLPKLWRNPSYLDRIGYEVSNSRGRQVASNGVDWAAVASDQAGVEVRQPPGPKNALGRLKIDFPNKHAIYLHDTPQKHLFAREQRAFSHGCVRLQQPRELAAALLGTSVAAIDAKIARGETQTERVRGDIAVYLAYFTAWPDAAGSVRYYKDVYGRDAHLMQAMDKTAAARGTQ